VRRSGPRSPAPEDLLLAGSLDDPAARESMTAFDALLEQLAAHRWAEHGQTADRLRALMSACAPGSAIAV
jgi:hypothetical protein